jgi:hypothetical protein
MSVFDEPMAWSLEDQMEESDEEIKGNMADLDSLSGIDMMSTLKCKNGDM